MNIKQNKGFNLKLIIIIIAFPILIFIVTFFLRKIKTKEDKNYIKDLDVNLIGKISQINELYYDYGLLSVNVIESNYFHLDDRGTRDRYFAVIDSQKAEILILGIAKLKTNDCLVINKNIQVFRNGLLVKESPILLTPKSVRANHVFYDKLKAYHEL